MTPEEFERLKEAEKAHLRKLKEIKQQATTANVQRRISGTLASMATGARQVLDENASLVEKMSEDLAMNEARLELAMESAEEHEREARLQEQEEELRRLRARKMVDDMRAQIGTAPEKASSEPPPRTTTESSSDQSGSLPEKTIGRMR